MKTWADIGFEIEITGDQSPSLRLLQSVDSNKFRGESMHHSGGAWSETQLIYAKPCADFLERQSSNLGIMVVGLGLGYIELCVARECLLKKIPPSNLRQIQSYESVPELREFFWNWLHNKTSGLHPEVLNIYDLVANFVTQSTGLQSQELKDFLKYHFKNLSDLNESLTPHSQLPKNIQVILYDAFSSKTTPYLWEEAFLNNLLQETSADVCIFATYACRASLKRALLANNFQVLVQPGFQGKRNSTLAIKE